MILQSFENGVRLVNVCDHCSDTASLSSGCRNSFQSTVRLSSRDTPKISCQLLLVYRHSPPASVSKIPTGNVSEIRRNRCSLSFFSVSDPKYPVIFSSIFLIVRSKYSHMKVCRQIRHRPYKKSCPWFFNHRYIIYRHLPLKS